MGIEGIMARSFAQFGVVQNDYDMRRLLTENALLRQPGGIQEAAAISPDILTPEGRESYAQIALLVRQAARRRQLEQAQALRQEAAEEARTELKEELRQEQREEARRQQREALAAMPQGNASREAADLPDSEATAAADSNTPGNPATDEEHASRLPDDRTRGDRQSLSVRRTEEQAAEQAPGYAEAAANRPTDSTGNRLRRIPLHLIV